MLKIKTTVEYPKHVHEKLMQYAKDRDLSLQAVHALMAGAFLKAAREGITFDAARALIAEPLTETEQKHRDLMAVCQDPEKPLRVRFEAMVELGKDIPADMVDSVLEYIGVGEQIERDTPHLEKAEDGRLIYIPPGMERYRKQREYWFDMRLISDPALMEQAIQSRIALGLDELAIRQRAAQMVLNPPTEEETGYEYYARLHKCTMEEAAARIARGE